MTSTFDIHAITNHVDIPQMPEGNYPLNPPIYQAVKYSWHKMHDLKAMMRGEKAGYFYTRYANPTVRTLENVLAKIQNREDCVTAASGLAAVTTCLMSLLKQGDHIIQFYESYRPTRIFIREWLPRFGITNTVLSVEDHAGIQKAIIPGKTKAILFESPTNPQMKIADIEAILKIAKKNQLITVMDNTFASFHNHGQYPVDLFIHSLTKYASGHGDAMGGAIIGNAPYIQQVKSTALALGSNLDPNSAYLLLRGMKTFKLRYDRQCQNAQTVAEWLSNHPKIKRISYPGLPSHPQHELAKKQMHDFGSMIMIEIDGTPTALDQIIDSLEVFKLAASLGSTESMVAPVMMFYASDLKPEDLAIAQFNDRCLRISVGIEDPQTLIADLNQAFLKNLF